MADPGGRRIGGHPATWGAHALKLWEREREDTEDGGSPLGEAGRAYQVPALRLR